MKLFRHPLTMLNLLKYHFICVGNDGFSKETLSRDLLSTWNYADEMEGPFHPISLFGRLHVFVDCIVRFRSSNVLGSNFVRN